MNIPSFRDCIHEVERLPKLVLELGPGETLCLLSQLQVASRHPKNRGPAADAARAIALRLQEYLAAGGPKIAELCEMGWDPKYDTERGNDPKS